MLQFYRFNFCFCYVVDICTLIQCIKIDIGKRISVNTDPTAPDALAARKQLHNTSTVQGDHAVRPNYHG